MWRISESNWWNRESTGKEKRNRKFVRILRQLPSSLWQQKPWVWVVSSAYLGLHGNDRLLADHFGSKLYVGFIEIRERLEELKRVELRSRRKETRDVWNEEEKGREKNGKNWGGSQLHNKNPKRSRPESIADTSVTPCQETSSQVSGEMVLLSVCLWRP
jgi:RNA-binding protein Luc7-like 2